LSESIFVGEFGSQFRCMLGVVLVGEECAELAAKFL
jgi:hypothetical protein